MKLSLTLCFLIFYTVNAVPTGDDQPVRIKGLFSTAHKSTNRLAPGSRRFNPNNTPTNRQCVNTCAREHDEQMERDLPNYDERETPKLGGEYDLEKLDKLCGIYNDSKTCLDRCQDSQIRTLRTKIWGTEQHMCQDSTFKKNAPCLAEVHNSTYDTCDAQSKCGQYKQKIDGYTQNQPADLASLKELIEKTCQYAKCTLDCEKPMIIEKCGQSAQNDMQGLVDKAVDRIKYNVESGGISEQVWSHHCDRVAAV